MIRRATMDDIAKVCGFSKMTVSRALGGGPGVSPEARRQVRAAAKKLRYEVNMVAQNLSRDRSGFIGVATAWEGLIGSNFFAEVFRGFSQALEGTAFNLALFDTQSESFNNGSKLAKLYRQRKVDGLLVVAPHTQDGFLKTLGSLQVPLVAVGEGLPDPSTCWVSCDNTEGITSVCRHLADLGHRRIAFIGGPENLTSGARRRKAFVEFFRQEKLSVRQSYLQPGDYTMRSGREAALALLKLSEPPTAIVAANDMMAFGVIESARELGIRIPDELSVTGFDDLPTAAERHPSLTTVRQPVAEMGEQSAQHLLAALAENELPEGHIRMPVALVVRNSTGPVPR
jgi:LacI family transcriptional regulator